MKKQAEKLGQIAKESELQQEEQHNAVVRQNKETQDAWIPAMVLKEASKRTGLATSEIIEWEKARKFGTIQPMVTAK